jgi:hypothetical protein
MQIIQSSFAGKLLTYNMIYISSKLTYYTNPFLER